MKQLAAVSCYLPGAYEMWVCSRFFARLEGRWGSFPIPLPQQKQQKKKKNMLFSLEYIYSLYILIEYIYSKTFLPSAGLVLCETVIFNATATCCFRLRRKIQGWLGTRTPVELIRTQAQPGWKDLVRSVPCHGQAWCYLGGPMVVAEGYSSSCSLGNAAQKPVGKY